MGGRLATGEIVIFLLALAILLATARALGELMKRFNQPSVLGEILAGILLGPTVLGTLSPYLHATIFPAQGSNALALNGLTTVAIVLFLLVAGMEVDLSIVWRQGKKALLVSLFGITIPAILGFSVAYFLLRNTSWIGGGDLLIFALFFAVAMSISALPVIAKTLMDLNLYRSDLGMIVISAAIVDDLIGWMFFAVLLGMIGSGATGDMVVSSTILLTIGFAVGMLTVGRWIIHRVLPWIQAHTSWPGGVLAFALAAALASAAYTEWIGIHAIFGSFIFGVALGDSSHLREQTRAIMDRFISFIFAPLFFASIGLQLNFITNFDPVLCLIVLAIAITGKITGSSLGARVGGSSWREAFAVGSGMISVGSMGIILGLLAFQSGVIDARMFVAIVVMAIVTSMMSGPLMERILQRTKRKRFTDFLSARCFVPGLRATDRRAAIEELARTVPAVANTQSIATAVWEREEMLATGLGNELAVPHARIAGLTSPVLAFGLSADGIDFDAPDGKVARIIVLILTPEADDVAQLEILADIARTFSDETLREKVKAVRNYIEFLALLRSERRD
ncbi:MAG: cation:proton antiporter [Ignavibacteriae bacterium]|nr:cation:proton antiporter [Ignavibacteriota bacterium]